MKDAEWEAICLDACGAFGVDPRGGLAQASLAAWSKRFAHLEARVVATAIAELQLEQDTQPQHQLVRQLPSVPKLANRIKVVLDRRPASGQRALPPPTMLPKERRALAGDCRARAAELGAGRLAASLVEMAERLEGDADKQERGERLEPLQSFGGVADALRGGRP